MRFSRSNIEPDDGSEPVSELADQPEVERNLVRSIRTWMSGPGYHEQITATLTAGLSAREARLTLRAFEGFMSNVSVSIQRHLYRHAPNCPCLGRDEALLLTIVRHAGAGDYFSASTHAAAIFRDDRIDPVVDAAAWLGEVLALQGVVEPRRAMITLPENKTLH